MPFIVAQIEAGEFFDNASIAYQIDRLAVTEGQALYLDEQGRLQSAGPMPRFGPMAYYSVTGAWDEPDPATGRWCFWPLYPPFAEGIADRTRARLCLDSVADFTRRNPRRAERLSAEAFRRRFGW